MPNTASFEEMMKMQSEAAERVKNMQKRAEEAVRRAEAKKQSKTNSANSFVSEKSAHSNMPHTKSTSLPIEYPEKHGKQADNHFNESEKHNFAQEIKSAESIKQSQAMENHPNEPDKESESDRSLVLLLLLLLSRQNADIYLLAALFYIIM